MYNNEQISGICYEITDYLDSIFSSFISEAEKIVGNRYGSLSRFFDVFNTIGNFLALVYPPIAAVNFSSVVLSIGERAKNSDLVNMQADIPIWRVEEARCELNQYLTTSNGVSYTQLVAWAEHQLSKGYGIGFDYWVAPVLAITAEDFWQWRFDIGAAAADSRIDKLCIDTPPLTTLEPELYAKDSDGQLHKIDTTLLPPDWDRRVLPFRLDGRVNGGPIEPEFALTGTGRYQFYYLGGDFKDKHPNANAILQFVNASLDNAAIPVTPDNRPFFIAEGKLGNGSDVLNSRVFGSVLQPPDNNTLLLDSGCKEFSRFGFLDGLLSTTQMVEVRTSYLESLISCPAGPTIVGRVIPEKGEVEVVPNTPNRVRISQNAQNANGLYEALITNSSAERDLILSVVDGLTDPNATARIKTQLDDAFGNPVPVSSLSQTAFTAIEFTSSVAFDIGAFIGDLITDDFGNPIPLFLTDAESCAVAYYAAERLANLALFFNTQVQTVTSLEQFYKLATTEVAPYSINLSDVKLIYTTLTQPSVNYTALDTELQSSLLRCEVARLLYNDVNLTDKANLATPLVNADFYTNVELSKLLPYTARAISTEQWNAWVQFAVVDNSDVDCTSFPCDTWTYEWDFESQLYRDNREFFHDGNPINGNVFGVYVDGSGHRTSGSDENAWMSAKTNNIHLTRLRIELTTQANAQPRIGIWDSNSGVTSPFGVAGDPIVDVPLDDLFDTLWIRFRYDNSNARVTAKKLLLEGKGNLPAFQGGNYQ